MKFILTPCNDFYAGYLTRVLEQPDDKQQNPIWRDGWKMADETPPSYRGLGFIEELRRTDHIKVEVTP